MDTVKISLNGNIKDVREGTTVHKLLKESGVDELKIVVQVSGHILRRNKFSQQILKDGDIVELISFVGGG